MCSSPADNSFVDQARENMVFAESDRCKDMRIPNPSSTLRFWSKNCYTRHAIAVFHTAHTHDTCCSSRNMSSHSCAQTHGFKHNLFLSPLNPFGISNGNQLWDTTLGKCIKHRIVGNIICSKPAWVNNLLIKSDLNPTKPNLNHDKSS